MNRDWVYRLTPERGPFVALGLWLAMFVLFLAKHPAGFSANVVNTAANKGALLALLAMAQLEAPQLYRTWLSVSLARLDARDEIVVKAQDIQEVVFSRKRDFRRQIAQLDYVVDSVRVMPEPALLSVNLSLEGQVPVKMKNTPEELAKLSPDNFSLQPPQRKSKRDL